MGRSGRMDPGGGPGVRGLLLLSRGLRGRGVRVGRRVSIWWLSRGFQYGISETRRW